MNCQILPELKLGRTDPQLRHLDRAWASTVHAFQGRTVDNVVAAMKVNHPYLTTRKSFYVEISRARDRAELVTDDAGRLRDQLEVVTGERISALEGIGEAVGGDAPARGAEATGTRAGRTPGREADASRDAGSEGSAEAGNKTEPAVPARERPVELDFDL